MDVSFYPTRKERLLRLIQQELSLDRSLPNHMDTGTTISAKMLSKAGKATGRNKNWYNIQCLKPEDYEGEKMSGFDKSEWT